MSTADSRDDRACTVNPVCCNTNGRYRDVTTFSYKGRAAARFCAQVGDRRFKRVSTIGYGTTGGQDQLLCRDINGCVAGNITDATSGNDCYGTAPCGQFAYGDIITGLKADITIVSGGDISLVHEDITGGTEVNSCAAACRADVVVQVNCSEAVKADVPVCANSATESDAVGTEGLQEDVAFRTYITAAEESVNTAAGDKNQISAAVQIFLCVNRRECVNAFTVNQVGCQTYGCNGHRAGFCNEGGTAGFRSQYGDCCFKVVIFICNCIAGCQNQIPCGYIYRRIPDNIGNITASDDRNSVAAGTKLGNGNIIVGFKTNGTVVRRGQSALRHNDVVSGHKVNGFSGCRCVDSGILAYGTGADEGEVASRAAGGTAEGNAAADAAGLQAYVTDCSYIPVCYCCSDAAAGNQNKVCSTGQIFLAVCDGNGSRSGAVNPVDGQTEGGDGDGATFSNKSGTAGFRTQITHRYFQMVIFVCNGTASGQDQVSGADVCC